MAKIHTHYDNLMVARNAPFEIIRASYLALSKKFHPDVNLSQDAPRIMKIINNSYDVLSDSDKRKLHDEWIQHEEAKAYSSIKRDNLQEAWEQNNGKRSSLSPFTDLKILALELLHFLARNPRLAFMVIGFSILGLSSMFEDDKPSYTPRSYVSVPHKVQKPHVDEFKRPIMAPNGNSWPITSAYVGGYRLDNKDGKSTLKIVNFQNDDDFYIKLVESRNSISKAVRHAFIKGKDEFVFKNISPGKYQIMYMNLNSGYITKSESFELQEIRENRGVRFSSMVITLFKVRNGNFISEDIDLDEFLNADRVSEVTNSGLNIGTQRI